MVEINLLPWREQKRQREKKLFIKWLMISSSIALVIVFSLNYHIVLLRKNQYVRNQILQQEIIIYDSQIKEANTLKKEKRRLISQISVVQNLQATRILLVHLLDELTKIVPSGIYFAQIKGYENVISVFGYAESNTDVSLVLQNIEHNTWIHNPILNEIKAVKKKQVARNRFKLTFILRPEYDVGIGNEAN